MFSSLDMRYAFLALKIDEKSRPLTTFLTPGGAYQWLSLPTGAASSPAHFTEALNKILHFEPELDEHGQPVYEKENVVKLNPSALKDTVNYFHDVLTATQIKNTFQITLEAHFFALEKAVERLSFHGAKINVNKCTFAKTRILFLGWIISNNHIIADPKRVQKVKDFLFPVDKKGMRDLPWSC